MPLQAHLSYISLSVCYRQQLTGLVVLYCAFSPMTALNGIRDGLPVSCNPGVTGPTERQIYGGEFQVDFGRNLRRRTRIFAVGKFVG